MPRAVPRPHRPDLLAPCHDTVARGVQVFDAAEVGQVLRWTRGVRQLPQAEAAASLGVGPDLQILVVTRLPYYMALPLFRKSFIEFASNPLAYLLTYWVRR